MPRFVIIMAVAALIGIGSLALILTAAPGASPDPQDREELAAAEVGPGDLTCDVARAGQPLPADLSETSGVARAGRADILWTHNDSGGQPVLFGLGPDGTLRERVRVDGAALVDWEDIEGARCGDGWCLYIADIGDNQARRDSVTIYEVREPPPGADRVSAAAIPIRYPDGPRDAEGLFAREGRLFVVTKGRTGPIQVYRVPERALPAEAAPAAGAMTVEPVADAAPRPENTADYVTAATATPDGSWIGLRTYRTLLLYPADSLVAGRPGTPRAFDLAPLAEPQGEGLVLGDDGDVWLTSEGRGGATPSWSRLTCSLP